MQEDIFMVRKSEVRKLFEDGTIKGYLPSKMAGTKIHVDNMGNYTGVIFVEASDAAGKALPILNLDKLYESVKDCADIVEAGGAAAAIVMQFMNNTYVPDIDFSALPEMLKDYDRISDRVYLAAVSPSYKNERTAIYNVEGMHFVPKLLLAQHDGDSITTVIPKAAIKDMGFTEKEFFDKVSVNTKNVLKPEIRDMYNILKDYNNNKLDVTLEEIDTQMLVVTSENKVKGAAALVLDDAILSRVADKYKGTNFYVLPSSITEVITMPAINENAYEIAFMTQMVEEVNETEVAADELLSYNVYHYDAKNHKLEKATDYCINKQLELEHMNMPRADEELDQQLLNEKNNNIKM